MKKVLFYGVLPLLFSLFLSSCGEHSGKTILEYTGDYRYSNGIAEFFDCKGKERYFLSKKGAAVDLQEKYQQLGIKGKDDVFMRVKGYVQEEQMMEGVDPLEFFVAVELLEVNQDRGCERGFRRGH